MKKKNLRVSHIACLWLLQERRQFLFIPYWVTLFSSPFLEDIEALAKFVQKSNPEHQNL